MKTLDSKDRRERVTREQRTNETSKNKQQDGRLEAGPTCNHVK